MAKTIADLILKSFEDFDVDYNGPIAAASIGLATLTTEEDFSALLNRADVALYQAKNGGRKQVAALRLVA